MAPKKQTVLKNHIFLIEILIIVLSLFLTPISVHAGGIDDTSLPSFSTFAESVQDGKADTLKGVYVSEVLALPVVQQPVGNPGFVSQSPNVVTEFGMANEVGNVGLLAHNHLAGQLFTNLNVGNEVKLVYGDGKVEYFIVTETLKYQALEPYSPYSEFRDLETDQSVTAVELFRQVYRGDRHVTFQVCIEANGVDAWGRLFVIAQPKPDPFVELNYLRQIAKTLISQ
jgi:hypothetical protein